MDEELEKLERSLRTVGSIPDRLRLAHALVRAGRGRDALPVLLPAREALEVRRELGAIWDTLDPSTFDLPRTRPAVRWRAKIGFAAGHHPWNGTVIATPLGVVAQGHSRQPACAFLDMDTGEVRHKEEMTQPGEPWPHANACPGGTLISWSDLSGSHVVRARDPWTNESHEHTLAPAERPLALHRGSLFVDVPDGQGGRRLVERAFTSFGRPPESERVLASGAVASLEATPSLLAVNVADAEDPRREVGAFVLDRRSGRELWRSSEAVKLAVDESGWAVETRTGLTLHDASGGAPRTAEGARLAALGRGAVVVVVPDGAQGEVFALVDRATGSIRRLGIEADHDRTAVVGRNAVVVNHGRSFLRSFAFDGRVLWDLDLGHERGWVLDLALAPDRIYGLMADASAFCLVASPTAKGILGWVRDRLR